MAASCLAALGALVFALPASAVDDLAANPELKRRAKKLDSIIICACPKEDWTVTLSYCPKPCADPQKKMVRALLAEGKSDEEIIDAMIAIHGPRVLAMPRSIWVYLLALAAVLAAVAAVIIVLRAWRRQARTAEAWQDAVAGGISKEELARVELELERLE
ncbi:MAG: cytochrome c-type biogenesis protein CcmH [Planctomycetes bacterium]|nr:cytochrome c-type biogenesis protein CcmH [Planctomycetota bacterium]